MQPASEVSEAELESRHSVRSTHAPNHTPLSSLIDRLNVPDLAELIRSEDEKINYLYHELLKGRDPISFTALSLQVTVSGPATDGIHLQVTGTWRLQM